MDGVTLAKQAQERTPSAPVPQPVTCVHYDPENAESARKIAVRIGGLEVKLARLQGLIDEWNDARREWLDSVLSKAIPVSVGPERLERAEEALAKVAG